ncbi:hypothetical protein OUZ56_011652 [Daphnia magna]|uniref:Paraneoplastic antigen Ma-like C-terminal domain-containing protein n=1 Tax=Daphnia magna TaxID=35525 RepID=A0ABQ9Z124_9CRUS|nr:hypothetical protein OUZ56_011652 [Daphnia magna]
MWHDIKISISNSPPLLARTIDWLWQSPSTSDFENICEARAVFNPPCQLPTAFPITCRTYTSSPICTQESFIIQANFTGSPTKLSDSAIKINQPLSPTIRSETVKTIAQPIALARRNSLPSKLTIRPNTRLTAIVSNKFLNEANRYTHFIKTPTRAKTQGSRKKQHEIPHAAKSPHQTRRPAHFNANVIIRQHSTSQSSCESLSPILTAQQAYTQPHSGGEKSKQTTDKRDSQQIPNNATYTTTRRLNATSIKTKQPAPPVAQSTPTENNKQFHRKQIIKMDPLQFSLVTNVIPIGDLQELQKGQGAQTMLIQLQNFTGGPSTRFDRWIKLFENIVAMSNWNEKEKMNMLVTKIAGSAHDILQNILESVTQDYKQVKRLLQERFHGNENQDFFQTQLEEVKRHPGEAIFDYGFRLKNIFEHGYLKGEDNT